MTQPDKVDIRITRSHDLELFFQARELAAHGRSEAPDEMTHVEVCRTALGTYVNRTPPINRFLTRPRVLELRADIANDLDTDAFEITPLAAIQDAVSHRIGAASSLDFLPANAPDIDGFGRACKLADVNPSDPAPALETIIEDYARLKKRESALAADGGGAAYGGRGWED